MRIIPTEEQDCIAFVSWLELQDVRFSHIPQETFTKSWGTKVKNKKMGVRPGVPDYIIVIERREKPVMLALEMKRIGAPPSSVKPQQREWLTALGKVEGIHAQVCRGYEEAVEVVKKFL